jgi:hypothetical protein
MEKISPAMIYGKVVAGEPLSDTEIDFGIEHFSKLFKMLNESGAAFAITAAECNRIVETLTNFRWSRNNRRNRSE